VNASEQLLGVRFKQRGERAWKLFFCNCHLDSLSVLLNKAVKNEALSPAAFFVAAQNVSHIPAANRPGLRITS
jgi:hypothetical protein